jgi:hypothetical protein
MRTELTVLLKLGDKADDSKTAGPLDYLRKEQLLKEYPISFSSLVNTFVTLFASC